MCQGYIKFFKFIICAMLFMPALLLIAPQASAASKDKKDPFIVEGQDYIKLPESIRNSTLVTQLFKANPNKVQVIFFFNYGCHGC